jgi:hypothetical protein
MSQLEVADTNITADPHDGTVAYVPPLLGRQEEAAGRGSWHRCHETWRPDHRLGRQAPGEGPLRTSASEIT